MLIAIRFYEVADRFKGHDVSLKAMDRSLKEMQAVQLRPGEKLSDPKPAAKAENNPPVIAPVVPAKAPVPSAASQRQVLKTLKDLFAKEYASVQPQEQAAFAALLLKQGLESENDRDAQYVQLTEARDLAIRIANVELALRAARQIDDSFAGEPHANQLAALNTLSLNAQSSASSLAENVERILNELIAAGKFQWLSGAAQAADSVAARVRDATASAALKASAVRAKDVAAQWKAVQPLLTKQLKGAALDPPENLALGKFYCFTLGDWEKGIRCLQSCSHEKFRAAAAAEAGDTQTAQAWEKIGGLWWDLSETEAASLRAGLKLRAGYWYDRARPGLSGLQKAMVDKRLAQVQRTLVSKAPPTLNGKSMIEPYAANPLVREWSERFNKLENWTINRGDWTLEDNGILGSDNSEATLKVKLPQVFIMEFTINIKKGMRPHMYFGSEVYFGNEGYSMALTVQNPQHGTPFKYENGQELKVRAIFDKKNYEFFIDETSVAKGARTKPDKMTFRISGGDDWSRGAVLYSNVKLLPTGQ